ncbi:hypothetical protein ANO11243_010080 [Dothideomycetidae sp. 11243]|nr:hypothetical protein ANO11243_010080 [fungal sp. No.11243]
MTVAIHSTGQYLHQAKQFELETRPVSQLQADEVQVAVRSTTLCGSDLHYHQHFRNGSILVREPLCLGHESAGVVTAVGAAVTNLQIGEAVALEVGVPCEEKTCDFCTSGRYNICPGLRFRSSGSKFPHFQGTLQEVVNHPARWVHRLPPELGFEIGALLEPLSVGIQAVSRIEGRSPSIARRSCLIFGAGAIGLLVSIAAQAAGIREVIMADIDAGRLDFAGKNGFATTTFVVPFKKAETEQERMAVAKDTAAEIEELTGRDGKQVGKLPVVFECTGVTACVQASVFAAKSGGAVVTVGLGVPFQTLPMGEGTAREIDIIPTWRYANTYSRAIAIATASVTGRPISEDIVLPDLRKLITHRLHGLRSIDEAFGVAARTKDETGAVVIKTVINFS